MRYTPIIGTLGYILSPDKKKVLLVHRTANKFDDHLGKYNGLGGKMHSDEDVMTCIRRELHEEAGIECLDIEFRGTINWTGFGANKESWLGFIFLIREFSGVPYESNPEGTLEWIDLDKIDLLPMWEGDKKFLPMVFDDDHRPFYGHMPYDGEHVVNWSFKR